MLVRVPERQVRRSENQAFICQSNKLLHACQIKNRTKTSSIPIGRKWKMERTLCIATMFNDQRRSRIWAKWVNNDICNQNWQILIDFQTWKVTQRMTIGLWFSFTTHPKSQKGPKILIRIAGQRAPIIPNNLVLIDSNVDPRKERSWISPKIWNAYPR